MAVEAERFGGPDEDKPLGGHEHVMVLKYQPNGQRKWLTRFGAEQMSSVELVGLGVSDMSASRSGALYVVGSIDGKFPQQTHAGDDDAYVTKIEAGGEVAWTRQFGGESPDHAWTVDVTADGEILVAGGTFSKLVSDTSGPGEKMAFVARFDASGQRKALWSPQGLGVEHEILDLAVSADDHIYLTGGKDKEVSGENFSGDPPYPFVAKVSLDGAVTWVEVLDAAYRLHSPRLTLDGKQRPYLLMAAKKDFAGHESSSKRFHSDVAVAAYDSSGSRRWTGLYGSRDNDIPLDATVDADGRLHVVGYTQGSLAGSSPSSARDGYVATWSSEGDRLSTDYVGRSGSQLFGASAGSDGAVYITGETRGSIDGQFFEGAVDAFLQKRHAEDP